MSDKSLASRCFLDTNVLVYVYAARDQRKQQLAESLVEGLISDQTVLISSQVVQEFCNVILKLNPEVLTDALQCAVLPLLQHVPSADFYKQALLLHERYSLGWYDAVIVQAAIDLECDTLYSEDLQAGQQFDSVTIVNPFV